MASIDWRSIIFFKSGTCRGFILDGQKSKESMPISFKEIPYLDNAIWQPSKIKLALESWQVNFSNKTCLMKWVITKNQLFLNYCHPMSHRIKLYFKGQSNRMVTLSAWSNQHGWLSFERFETSIFSGMTHWFIWNDSLRGRIFGGSTADQKNLHCIN